MHLEAIVLNVPGNSGRLLFHSFYVWQSKVLLVPCVSFVRTVEKLKESLHEMTSRCCFV